MSWNARDYDGETDAVRYREYEEACEREREMRAARDEEETIACELADRVEASEVAAPVAIAVGGWLRAVTREATRETPRMACIGNGLYFPTGNGRRRNRRAA